MPHTWCAPAARRAGCNDVESLDNTASSDSTLLRRAVYTSNRASSAKEVAATYPYRAVEEILANAVYHRSYQVHEPVTVRITPSGMEVISFPGFARSITDEDIADKIIRGRTYRNRRIGDFLKELRLIEGHNTGFPNAYAALAENGSPDLRFQMDDERSFLAVTIPVHPHFLPGNDARTQAYEKRILQALSDEPLSLTMLAHAMGYKGISKKLSTTVERLLAQRRLECVASTGARTTLLRVVR